MIWEPPPPYTMAAQRDASWFDRPNVTSPKQVHVWGVGDMSGCGGSPLDDSLLMPLDEVPVHRRCRRRGCREHWPPPAETPEEEPVTTEHPASRIREILDALRTFKGHDVFNLLIARLPEYDRAATDATYRVEQDAFVLDDGTRVEWDGKTWSASRVVPLADPEREGAWLGYDADGEPVYETSSVVWQMDPRGQVARYDAASGRWVEDVEQTPAGPVK